MSQAQQRPSWHQVRERGANCPTAFVVFVALLRKYFILWDIVNPQLGLGLGLGLGLDSMRGSTISHKMKYLPSVGRTPLTIESRYRA